MNDKFVFVYGTLKFGYPLHGHLEALGAEYVGEVTIPHSHLIHLGAFPALVLVGQEEKNWAKGEIWAVSTFEFLDRIEGVPRFYRRDIVAHAAHPRTGENMAIYAYHQTGKDIIDTCPMIPGGAWNHESETLYDNDNYGFRPMNESKRERMNDNFEYAMQAAHEDEEREYLDNESEVPEYEAEGFPAWMSKVDEEMRDLCQMTSSDLADWGYYDAWENEMEPKDAALDAIRADDIGEMLLEELGL